MNRRHFLAALLAADWQRTFPVDRKNLGISGSNSYFPLEPGLKLRYQHGTEVAVSTVLAETKRIDGMEARAVEVRETKGGRLAEVTRDYYAIDRTTSDVYYLGEEVDNYKDGKVTGHSGAWMSGVNGAHFGLMMPGELKPGMKFYQELAPGVAMDRAELVAVDERVVTPAGTFQKCVHFRETSPLEILATDHKWYAPGVGLVKDGSLVLVEFTGARS